MTNPLIIYRPGSLVTFRHGPKTRAFISQVTIKDGGSVIYQVSWWIISERKEAWVDEEELMPLLEETAHTQIGFRNPGAT